jgi:hypothetical protein
MDVALEIVPDHAGAVKDPGQQQKREKDSQDYGDKRIAPRDVHARLLAAP